MAKELRSQNDRGYKLTAEYLHGLFPTIEPYVKQQTGPLTIISDLDGTLCDHEGIRSPYDTAACEQDRVHEHVASILDNARVAVDIVLLSGREDTYRPETLRWLEANNIIWDELFMRKAGDQRRDSVVKLEIFNEHLRHRNIFFAIDDRLRVAQVWHALGLPLCRVGDPAADF